MSDVKVYANTEVYGILKLSDGTSFYYFPDGGSVANIIDLVSSFDLKGRGILKSYDATGLAYGVSLQALVTIKAVTYGNADAAVLAFSPYKYELQEIPSAVPEP